MITFHVYGPGCARCVTLADHAAAAAAALGEECRVEKVTDTDAIIEAGVMRTPGLAVNGELRSTGKLLSVDEIKTLLGA